MNVAATNTLCRTMVGHFNEFLRFFWSRFLNTVYFHHDYPRPLLAVGSGSEVLPNSDSCEASLASRTPMWSDLLVIKHVGRWGAGIAYHGPSSQAP